MVRLCSFSQSPYPEEVTKGGHCSPLTDRTVSAEQTIQLPNSFTFSVGQRLFNTTVTTLNFQPKTRCIRTPALLTSMAREDSLPAVDIDCTTHSRHSTSVTSHHNSCTLFPDMFGHFTTKTFDQKESEIYYCLHFDYTVGYFSLSTGELSQWVFSNSLVC